MIKDLAVGIVVGAILFWVPAFVYEANAGTQDEPCISTYDTICNGPVLSCNTGFDNCSPTPGIPGTWNPRGYTPKMGIQDGWVPSRMGGRIG